MKSSEEYILQTSGTRPLASDEGKEYLVTVDTYLGTYKDSMGVPKEVNVLRGQRIKGNLVKQNDVDFIEYIVKYFKGTRMETKSFLIPMSAFEEVEQNNNSDSDSETRYLGTDWFSKRNLVIGFSLLFMVLVFGKVGKIKKATLK